MLEQEEERQLWLIPGSLTEVSCDRLDHKYSRNEAERLLWVIPDVLTVEKSQMLAWQQ